MQMEQCELLEEQRRDAGRLGASYKKSCKAHVPLPKSGLFHKVMADPGAASAVRPSRMWLDLRRSEKGANGTLS